MTTEDDTTYEIETADGVKSGPFTAKTLDTIADIVAEATTGRGSLGASMKDYERVKEMDKLMKVFANLGGGIPAEMEALDSTDLKKKVLNSQQNFLASERRRKLDERLAAAKKAHDDLKGPYDDAKKLQSAIVQYGMLLLEGRGVPLGDADDEESASGADGAGDE